MEWRIMKTAVIEEDNKNQINRIELPTQL